MRFLYPRLSQLFWGELTMMNKMAYLPKPESGTKCPKTSTRRNNPLVRTTTSESLEIHLFLRFYGVKSGHFRGSS